MNTGSVTKGTQKAPKSRHRNEKSQKQLCSFTIRQNPAERDAKPPESRQQNEKVLSSDGRSELILSPPGYGNRMWSGYGGFAPLVVGCLLGEQHWKSVPKDGVMFSGGSS
jgi:hypothetical protein